jgi:hypothetical protein
VDSAPDGWAVFRSGTRPSRHNRWRRGNARFQMHERLVPRVGSGMPSFLSDQPGLAPRKVIVSPFLYR